MKIESVEVIPMRKESIWEDISNPFEVAGITTSYEEWEKFFVDYINKQNRMSDHSFSIKIEFNDECKKFAKLQHAFMTTPTSLFGKITFVSKSIKVNTLENMVLEGPLHNVHTISIDDIDAGKTVERHYVDKASFQPMFGMWYPKKEIYLIRYGVEFG